MAFITEQLVGDHGMQIGCEEVIRPMSIGTSWTRLKIGIRFALTATAGLPVTNAQALNAQFKLGFCTGTTGSIGNVTDAIWAEYWSNSVGNQIAYLGTAPNKYVAQAAGSINTYAYQRVGNTTIPFSSASTHSNVAVSASPSVLHSCAMWILDKGTASTTVSTLAYWMSAAQAVTDMTRSAFLLAMELDGTPSSMTAGSTISAVTLPAGRYTKDWNSAFVGWSRSTPSMTVYDLCIMRYS